MTQKNERETALREDPIALHQVQTRRCPVLSWTDAAGEHDVSVDGKITLGSRQGSGVFVRDPSVSRLHADVELLPDGLWITDLGSKNGTFVDGVRVRSARVRDRGVILVGGTEITADYGAPAVPIDVWPEARFGELVGESLVMRELFARLDRLAKLDDAVLIHGETGTGKEVVARAIHDASARREAPFVVVDCGALSQDLIEAELFGHARGAFTGAEREHPGSFEVAHGGTLFLDEIGELPLEFQAKLLRAVESKRIRRLGDNEERDADVRVIAATHRNLRELVNVGDFREDLYFRIAVYFVTVPPLRARPEDIPLLVREFAKDEADTLLTPEVRRGLAARSWPGNVRELRGWVRRARALGVEMAGLRVGGRVGSAAEAPNLTELPFADARARALAAFEENYVREVLARYRQDATKAAEFAGITPSYVRILARRHLR